VEDAWRDVKAAVFAGCERGKLSVGAEMEKQTFRSHGTEEREAGQGRWVRLLFRPRQETASSATVLQTTAATGSYVAGRVQGLRTECAPYEAEPDEQLRQPESRRAVIHS